MAINQIGELASGVVEYDFDYITGVSEKSALLTTTSGCLSGTLGQLNVLINQSFGYTGTDGNPSPLLQEEEKEILVQIYLKDYYFKEARRVMRGLYDQTSASAMGLTDWTSLREGDTTIQRSTFGARERTYAAREYREMAREADKKITELVYAYNMYGAQPRQVAGADTYNITGSGGCYPYPLYAY
jgi:hypothetical protein